MFLFNAIHILQLIIYIFYHILLLIAFLPFKPFKNRLYYIYGNRPFYRYGGHIELIRCKEYYRMPRGHEHISFVFSSAFRDIFS